MIISHCAHNTNDSQLQMFMMLMQQSPEVLTALGVSPGAIHNEISKQENMTKLKVRYRETSVRKDNLDIDDRSCS